MNRRARCWVIVIPLLLSIAFCGKANEVFDLSAEAIAQVSHEWEAVKGDSRFWSYQDKAAFYQEYGAIPYISSPIGIHYALPAEGDTSYEDALHMVKDALITYLGVNAGQLEALLVSSCFCIGWHPNKASDVWDDAWVFQFCEPAGMNHPLYDGFVLSPEGRVLLVRERNVEREQNDSSYIGAIWATENTLFDPATMPESLYYNPKGGKYYHYDADCTSVSQEYRPMTAFATELLSMEPSYSVLLPCPKCTTLE